MSEPMLTPRQRPVGVTIISILDGILGVLYILGGILTFSLGSAAAGRVPAAGTLGATAGVIFVIIGIITLVLAWGLWSLKKWAYWITAVLQALSLLFGLISIVGGNHSANTVIQTVIALIVVVYLFADQNVRAAFRT
jgi:hypothetical protein